MNYTPAGPISVAVAAAQVLLANVAYFQTWTGAESAAAAAANIFAGEVGFPIASITIVAGIATVQTREPHNLLVGQTVTIQGASIALQTDIGMTGSYAVTSVTTNTFTAVVGTSNFDYPTITPQGAMVLPCSEPIACLSAEPGSSAFNSEVIGTGGACVLNGALELLVENSIPTEYQNDPTNALIQAESEYGQILQGIAQTQGTLDFICLNRIETVAAPQFISIAEQNDSTVRFERWRALARLTWGLSA